MNDEARIGTVLDLLDKLETVKATTDLLKATKIGVYVNELRKHAKATDALKEKAREIVGKWKKDVGKGDGGKHSPVKSNNSEQKKPAPTSEKKKPPVKVELPRSNSQDSVKGSSGPTTPASAQPERTIANDGVDFRSTGDAVRDKCVDMLYTSLAIGSDESSSVIIAKATRIESLVHQDNGGTTQKYRSRIRSLYMNLKDKNNPELRVRVVNGDIAAEKFAKMTHEEMMSDKRKAEAEAAHKLSLMEAQTAADQQAETDQFKCGKCKSRRCKYFQMQTRSADEPMTTFVTCLNCNHRWRFC
ncbi:RNA polymerase II elongation factor [Quaeritorhiza haematococci]|nr:RNA polymerase II elongation factor [Quaeritorhiza haematococci]